MAVLCCLWRKSRKKIDSSNGRQRTRYDITGSLIFSLGELKPCQQSTENALSIWMKPCVYLKVS